MRDAPATPAVSTHYHGTSAQVQSTSAEASAQAASALQAPATNTTSITGQVTIPIYQAGSEYASIRQATHTAS